VACPEGEYCTSYLIHRMWHRTETQQINVAFLTTDQICQRTINNMHKVSVPSHHFPQWKFHAVIWKNYSNCLPGTYPHKSHSVAVLQFILLSENSKTTLWKIFSCQLWLTYKFHRYEHTNITYSWQFSNHQHQLINKWPYQIGKLDILIFRWQQLLPVWQRQSEWACLTPGIWTYQLLVDNYHIADPNILPSGTKRYTEIKWNNPVLHSFFRTFSIVPQQHSPTMP